MATTKTPTARAAASAAGSTDQAPEGTWVHAYRRLPHMVIGPGGVGEVEKAVEVVACGEKIKFKSNEEGHIVGLVMTKEALHRLVVEIPEAYIVYKNGDNVPEKPAPGSEDIPKRPAGTFVLESGEGQDKEYLVLDTLDDTELRAFAKDTGLEPFPDSVTGDNLRRAIFNMLGGAPA
jgi:hypothetical protein